MTDILWDKYWIQNRIINWSSAGFESLFTYKKWTVFNCYDNINGDRMSTKNPEKNPTLGVGIWSSSYQAAKIPTGFWVSVKRSGSESLLKCAQTLWPATRNILPLCLKTRVLSVNLCCNLAWISKVTMCINIKQVKIAQIKYFIRNLLSCP